MLMELFIFSVISLAWQGHGWGADAPMGPGRTDPEALAWGPCSRTAWNEDNLPSCKGQWRHRFPFAFKWVTSKSKMTIPLRKLTFNAQKLILSSTAAGLSVPCYAWWEAMKPESIQNALQPHTWIKYIPIQRDRMASLKFRFLSRVI